MKHQQIPWVDAQQQGTKIVVRCEVCSTVVTVDTPAQANQVALAHKEHRSAAAGHYGAGDAIAAATKAMGISACTPCEKRRQMLNGMLPKVFPRRW